MASALLVARGAKLRGVDTVPPLRVLIVGTTPDDVERMRQELSRRPDLEAAGYALVGESTSPPAGAGVLLTPAAAVALANASRPPAHAEEDLPEQLTRREIDVLARAADGGSNKEIAAALGISEHTVKFHLASIYGKLGVRGRTEAVQRGLRLGLIEI